MTSFLFELLINISNYFNENYLFSILLFSSFLFFYSFFSLPGLMIILAFSGYIYGYMLGYFISIISITFGCTFFYLFAKNLIIRFFPKLYHKYSSNINKYIKNSSFEYLLIFRMIPGPPLVIQNLLLSILNISFVKFLFATMIGLTPIILFCNYIGFKLKNLKDFQNLSFKDIFTYEFLLIIFILISIILIRIKLKNKKSPN